MDARYYRQKADHCCRLIETTVSPEIREQLRLWQTEFDDLAARIEGRRRRRVAGCWAKLRRVIDPAEA
jgi:hypothetical protein